LEPIKETLSGGNPYPPDLTAGLSAEQVSERIRQGQSNRSEAVKTKSVSQIVRSNLITPFNILNVVLASLILAVGSYKNLLFMGVIVCNTLIGTLQEIRAKKTIDRLAVITEPKACVLRDGRETEIPVEDIVLDDITVLRSGNQVCADCTILSGECEADESLVTGEADPVVKCSGDSLKSGSFLVSGSCRARVEHVGAENYAAKITASGKKQKKPTSEILNWTNRIIKIIGFSIIPIGCLLFYKQFVVSGQSLQLSVVSTVAALIGMIPEGLVLLTSVVLAVSVIRLARHRTLVQELYSIEVLARVDVLCLDKTGTITEGSLQTDEILPLNGFPLEQSKEALAALAAALSDDRTPTMSALRSTLPAPPGWSCSRTVAFSSARKWSGACFEGAGCFLLGAGEFILRDRFESIRSEVERHSADGHRVLLLAQADSLPEEGGTPSGARPAALILLSDRIRKNAPQALAYFAEQGVELKVISGDNPLTVASIAKRAGLKDADRCVDASTLERVEDLRAAAERYTVFGRVTPKQKLELVKALKEKQHTVAMTGDGVNDVPALRESDCSIAMASGSDAARAVSQLVLLDSDFAVMPKIVAEGRRSINNLQRSASLFLVKAIFSGIIAVVFLFLQSAYPFQPIQFTLINAVTIGFPSFILALEPNRERLRGSFRANVMEKSVPGALTMALNILLLTVLAQYFHFARADISTLSVLITGYTGLLILYKVCWPFKAAHLILAGSMTAAFVLALLLFPTLFEVTALSVGMVFLLIPLMLFSASLMAVLFHLIEKIILKK
jgi:cation-transporting P-type ATPase E